MKKALSTLLAAAFALTFGLVNVASAMKHEGPAAKTEGAAAAEGKKEAKKEAKAEKKMKKKKASKKKHEKKEEHKGATPATPATPAAPKQ